MSVDLKNICKAIPILPKIDLHRHLIGSVRIQTLLDIATEYNIPLPEKEPEKLRKIIEIEFPVSSLVDFLRPLRIIGKCFCNKEAIRRIAYEVVEDAARENIVYLELIIGPAYEASFHNLPMKEIINGIICGVESAERKYQIKVMLIMGPTFKWKKEERALQRRY